MQTESITLALDANFNYKRFNNIFCEIIPQTPYNLIAYKPSFLVELLCDGYGYCKAHLNNVKPCVFGTIPITIVEVSTGYSYAYAREYFCKFFNVSNEKLDETPVILLVLRKYL